MMSFFIKFALLLLSVGAICIFKNPVISTFAQVFAGLFAGILGQSVADNWRYVRFVPRLLIMRIRDQKLRISFSALIRIKVGSDYLLVKSKRIPDQWQPAGGVYRYFDKNKINELKLKSDNGFTKVEPGELRLSFSEDHTFNVLKLFRWFESGLGRETSPHREYKEELIDTGYLRQDIFGNPDFEFLCREYELSYSSKFSVWESKIFEIFELNMTDEQINSLKEAVARLPQNLLLLDQKHIESAGFVNDERDYKIGGHTKYIL